MKSPFNTIRGKVSAIAVAVSAVAMVAVVAVVGRRIHPRNAD